MTSYVENSHEYRYTYDKRGNLVLEENCERTTQGNRWITEAAYEYNAANRLAIGTNAKGEKSVYTYNGLGQRVRNEYIVQDNGYDYTTFDCTPPSVEVGFETPEVVVRDFVIDQTSPIEEVLVESEKDGFDYRYTVGLDRISVNVLSPESDTNHERTQTATKQWLHADRLGSTVNSTDSFGRVTERTDYNEWGEITYHAPIQNTLGYRSISTDCTYTNHDYDVVLGLYYAKARMYDVGIKRFVETDRVEGTALLPETLNRYVYVKNNSLAYVDPWGYAFYSSTRITNGSGVKNDFASETSRNVLEIQLHLMVDGYLSYDEFSQSFGYVNDSTFNAINNYKVAEGLTNSGKAYGVVGATTWKHMGGHLADEGDRIASYGPSSDEAIIGIALAQYLLNSTAIMQSQSAQIVYVGTTSYYSRWTPQQFTFGKKYYEQLQCAIKARKLGEIVLFGVDIAETGWNSFNQAAEISGGEPFTTIAGTIVLTGANYIFDTGEPSVSDTLSDIVSGPLDVNVKNAANQFDAIYASTLRYVITADLLYDAMDYYRVRNFTLQRIADAVETLNSVTLNVAPYNEKEVRRSAKHYLASIMYKNIDYSSAKESEDILTSKFR